MYGVFAAPFKRRAGMHALKTMPWGNKTFQFHDPEGTAVSLYMPATEETRRRFGGEGWAGSLSGDILHRL
jgi:hypothetical protein